MPEEQRKGIVILLGAGASVEAGIPGAREMAVNFIQEIEKAGSKEERNVLRKIRSLASFEFDIEWLVSVLGGIAESQTSPFFPLVANWKFDITNHDLIDKAKTLTNKVRANLLKWLQPQKDCTYLAPISTFVYHLSQLENAPRDRHAHVFTLNYDQCVEIALINKHIPYETGFVELSGFGEYCLWNQRLLGMTRVTLYKLHGSLNWGAVEGVHELVCEPFREFEGGGLINARMRRPSELSSWGRDLILLVIHPE